MTLSHSARWVKTDVSFLSGVKGPVRLRIHPKLSEVVYVIEAAYACSLRPAENG